MIAVVLAWLSGYLSAKFVRNVWLSILCAIFGGALSAFVGVLLTRVFVPTAFSVGELTLKFFVGCFWYTLVSLVALFVHRKRSAAAPSGTKMQSSKLPKAWLDSLSGWVRLLIGVSIIWLVIIGFAIYMEYPTTDSTGFFPEGPFKFWALVEDPFNQFGGSPTYHPEPNLKTIIGYSIGPLIIVWLGYFLGSWARRGFRKPAA